MPANITVKRLFECLIERYGKVVRNRIFENDILRPNIIIILDGKSIDFSKELETKLHEDSSISIITAVVGG